jgi:hypothetical protein
MGGRLAGFHRAVVLGAGGVAIPGLGFDLHPVAPLGEAGDHRIGGQGEAEAGLDRVRQVVDDDLGEGGAGHVAVDHHLHMAVGRALGMGQAGSEHDEVHKERLHQNSPMITGSSEAGMR